MSLREHLHKIAEESTQAGLDNWWLALCAALKDTAKRQERTLFWESDKSYDLETRLTKDEIGWSYQMENSSNGALSGYRLTW